jgi:hypothetical protein
MIHAEQMMIMGFRSVHRQQFLDRGRSPRRGKRKESSTITKEAEGGAMGAMAAECVAARGKARR